MAEPSDNRVDDPGGRLNRGAFANLSLSVLSVAANAGIGLITVKCLLSLLPKEGYGDYVLFLAVSALLLVAFSWLETGITHFGARESLASGRLAKTLTACLLLSVLMLCVLGAAGAGLSRYWGGHAFAAPPVLTALVVYVASLVLLTFGVRFAMVAGQVGRAILIPLGFRLLYALYVMLLLWRFEGAGLIHILAGLIASALAPSLILWGLLLPRLGLRFDRSWMGEMARYSSPFLAGNASERTVRHVDEIVIAGVLDRSVLAVYGLAYVLVHYIGLMATAMANVLLPLFQYWVLEGKRKLADGYMALLAPQLVFAAAFLLSLAILVAPWLLCLIHPDYVSAAPILRALLAAVAFAFLHEITALPLPANRHTFWPMVALVIFASINIVLDVWWVPRFGAMGAAVATVCVFAGRAVVTLALVERLAGFRCAWRALGPLCMPLVAWGCFSGFASPFASYGGACFGMLFLTAWFWYTGLFSPETPKLLEGVHMPPRLRHLLVRVYGARRTKDDRDGALH